MNRSGSIIGVCLAVLGLMIFILVGLWMWKQESSQGPYGFDLGWLAVSIAISRGVSGWRTEDKPKWKQYLMIVAPVLWVAPFGFVAHYSLQEFYSNPSRSLLVAFAACWVGFLLLLIALIARFPYERLFALDSGEEVNSWRRIGTLSGIAIGGIVAVGTLGLLLMRVGRNDFSILDDLDALETWLYKASFLVYAFLALKMYMPLLEARLFRGHSGST